MSASEDALPRPRPRRLMRPSLRQATLILPKTGERVRRSFTLRSTLDNGDLDASTPLLGRRRALLRSTAGEDSGLALARLLWNKVHAAVTSSAGRGVLKCSMAYLLASLATFVPVISDLLGRSDGKHVVATVVTYFHPSRSAGSMIEACLLALVAFIYAAFVSFTSMAVSVFFGKHDLLAVGHGIVLAIFCGAGLGFVGWLKQRLGNPLVNVACSLASLTVITVLTTEGAVQAAKFSYSKVFQVLKIVLLGICISSIVSFAIAPRSASKELREDFIKITDLLEEILTSITRGFLSGSEDELTQDAFAEAQKNYKMTFNSLVKNLREARFEHYLLGSEDEYKMEVRLVKCIERLAQSLVGLRSAASTQYSLITESRQTVFTQHGELTSPTRVAAPNRMVMSPSTLEAITEFPELSPTHSLDEQDAEFGQASATWPSDIFSLFISQLGPPMKSLAFTMKGVLNELPFGPGPQYEITFSEDFHRNLTVAKGLFISARREALEVLYTQRITVKTRPLDVDAAYEEVAASCGHFSSCLEDFADDTLAYLNILQELKSALHDPSRKRSWSWMKLSWSWMRLWHGRTVQDQNRDEEDAAFSPPSEVEAQPSRVPSPGHFQNIREQKVVKNYRNTASLSYRIWRALGVLRREDVKYAIKVGLGAMLFASFSFIPSTRPWYSRWRGEWGLLSYMLVCSMTIGASNTTGLQRFIGTCIGAALAILGWILSSDEAVVLALFGWLVSIGCFYIILVEGKGPMGRFVLLTYNLSALYAYSLSVKDQEDDDDEGGVSPEIWGIVLHRVVSVMAGCIWGIIVTRLIWPISARKKVKDGTALLWLRMGLIWKRDPLQMLIEGPMRSAYMDIREAIELQRFLFRLEALKTAASYEFDLRGPFPNELYDRILDATGRMLGAFHAMQVVISKDIKASRGETELLHYTRLERMELSARISHLFSVLASSMKLEYPMNDSLPNIEHARDRFLAKLFAYRRQAEKKVRATDEDFELLYAYGLVTGQIADEIEGISRCIEQLYGILNEESLKLR